MLSFLFLEEGKLFIKKSSFEEFNLVFFTAERMVCFEMQPRQQSFCWVFSYILHSMAKTITFLKGNLCILKCFIDDLQIFLPSAKEKLENAPIWDGFKKITSRYFRSLIGQLSFHLVPNARKWMITSIGQSKHMRVKRFNSLWVSGNTKQDKKNPV